LHLAGGDAAEPPLDSLSLAHTTAGAITFNLAITMKS
jgi:hypothetical protein